MEKVRQTEDGGGGLARMVDRALDALSTNRRGIGLMVAAGVEPSIEMGSGSFHFGADRRSRTLAWERLVDALPGAVERARLEAMHRAASASWSAPWSVYATATTVAWLVHRSDGRGTPAWADVEEAIHRAAELDGTITLGSEVDIGTLTGILRSRQLKAKIRPGRNTIYSSTERIMLARSQIPATVAMAASSKRPNMADIIEMPWVREFNVLVDAVTVGDDGTVLALREELVPLIPIPVAALRAAPTGGPNHAPWIVTATERRELDAVDAEAHLLL